MNDIEIREKLGEAFQDEHLLEMICAFVNDKASELARQTIYQLPAGELLDKFMVCHVRMWNLEEEITSNKNDKEVAQASRRLREVNSERASLREEVNRRFSGYGVGTEKSYMRRMDRYADGEEEE